MVLHWKFTKDSLEYFFKTKQSFPYDTYDIYLASENAFAFADNKKVAGHDDKNTNNRNNAKHHL